MLLVSGGDLGHDLAAEQALLLTRQARIDDRSGKFVLAEHPGGLDNCRIVHSLQPELDAGHIACIQRRGKCVGEGLRAAGAEVRRRYQIEPAGPLDGPYPDKF